MRMMRNLIGGMLLLGATPTYAASGLDALNHFFNNIETFQARFGQVVLNESLQQVDSAQGQVWIKRPGQFRWDYDEPEPQEIVGDGKQVWLYDVELEQVTVRDQQSTLGRTPAILLSGDGDIEETYAVEDIGKQGRYEWVNLLPKTPDSPFSEVRIGFEDNRLRLMELVDSLEQRTRITFVDIKENTPIKASLFDFDIPDGVDVIDESIE